MTPDARIEAVIELLDEVLSVQRPADAIASAWFRARRYIGSKDRAAISARFYRILREYHRLSWWIAQAGVSVIGGRTLVISELILNREHSPSSLAQAFSGDRFTPDPLSKEERTLAAFLEDKVLDDPSVPAPVRMECPEWALAPLQRALGGGFEKEMTAMLGQAPLDLRVNRLKATRDDVLRRLQEDGFDAHAGRWSPLSIRVFGRPQIAQHELFREGAVEIQDEGSQMVALVAGAKPGEQVVDFCAGAGGKTLALGADMDNRGRIVAMDVLGGRLLRAKERFRRAGLHNVETRPLTSERDKFVKRHAGHFDLVLVDAPCSGTGTWRRDPDKRWRQLGPGLSELVPLQREILESAMRMVKPGGRLVYATCSLLPEENEDQMASFLQAHPEFEIVPVRVILRNEAFGDFLRMTPAGNDTDGFFAAVLKRK